MYVCVCNAVTEKHVFQAVEDGAATMKALRDTLNIGSECGSCLSCAKTCLSVAKSASKKSNTVTPKTLIKLPPLKLGII